MIIIEHLCTYKGYNSLSAVSFYADSSQLGHLVYHVHFSRTCCNNIGYHGFFDRIIANFGSKWAPWPRWVCSRCGQKPQQNYCCKLAVYAMLFCWPTT